MRASSLLSNSFLGQCPQNYRRRKKITEQENEKMDYVARIIPFPFLLPVIRVHQAQIVVILIYNCTSAGDHGFVTGQHFN
jgi:hypothetical protein